MKKVLVIGGPGNISTSTLTDLVGRGDAVGLFSKPESRFEEVDPMVRIFPGERSDASILAAAFNSFQPEIVLDMACFLPEHAEQIASLAAGRVEQFVFVSTVDVYGFPLAGLPMKETDTWQKQANSEYAENKRRCEAVFKVRAEKSSFPLTIVRPGYSFSERFIISALNRSAAPDLLYCLQNGLPLLVPGDGRTLIHVSSGYNTGRMVSKLAGSTQAIGKEYTLAHPTPMEYADYLHLFANAVGKEPMLVHVPSDLVLSLTHPDMKNNLLAELAQYNLYFSVAHFLADFPDFEFEPLEVAARRAVRWNFANGLVEYKPNIEERIISAYQRCMAQFSL
jgi:nucleoside-diphosphate-sugar epimerase